MPNISTGTLAPVNLATRLKLFGLDPAALTSDNLEVAANQTVVLDAADPKYAKQLVQLTPKSIDDLKSWIGVPDKAFAHPPTLVSRTRMVVPVHDAYTAPQSMALRALAAEYVFGHSGSVSAAQLPALNAWLASASAYIHLLHFQDIHVAAGARLVVNPSVVVLFANHITIDHGGVIQLKATHSGIHCAGIQGNASRIRLGDVVLNPIHPVVMPH